MKFFKLIVSVFCLLAVQFTVNAGQSQIVATNSTYLTATTNLLSGVYYAGQSSDISFMPFVTVTNATTNAFVFDASVDGVRWPSNLRALIRLTASQSGTGTNEITGAGTNLASGFRYPFWRVWVENPSSYAIKSPTVATFSKTGI